MPDEALSQALRLKAAKEGDGQPAKLQVVTAGVTTDHSHQRQSATGLSNHMLAVVVVLATLGETVDRNVLRRSA
jgi:hypothetical protein